MSGTREKKKLLVQIAYLKISCEEALMRAKSCYPSSFFGESKEITEQRTKIETLEKNAIASIEQSMRGGTPLTFDETPFHAFMRKQEDKLFLKNLTQNVHYIAAKNQIDTLINLIPPQNQEPLRQELNLGLQKTVGLITSKKAGEGLLLAHNENLNAKIKSVQNAADLYQQAKQFIAENKLAETTGSNPYSPEVERLFIEAQESFQTGSLREYISRMEELRHDLRLITEINSFRKPLQKELLKPASYLDTSGFLSAEKRLELEEERAAIGQEYVAWKELRKQRETEAHEQSQSQPKPAETSPKTGSSETTSPVVTIHARKPRRNSNPGLFDPRKTFSTEGQQMTAIRPEKRVSSKQPSTPTSQGGRKNHR